eukprot:Seg359.6 transcript_id=Seg359.6/GoldUCD/mRNA.D3Y31 product="hypothetical protein" protein_id=Seg359.6/GoldUCD/D3Y31
MDTEKRLAEDEMSDDVPDEQEKTKTAIKVETKRENAKRARIGGEKLTKKEMDTEKRLAEDEMDKMLEEAVRMSDCGVEDMVETKHRNVKREEISRGMRKGELGTDRWTKHEMGQGLNMDAIMSDEEMESNEEKKARTERAYRLTGRIMRKHIDLQDLFTSEETEQDGACNIEIERNSSFDLENFYKYSVPSDLEGSFCDTNIESSSVDVQSDCDTPHLEREMKEHHLLTSSKGICEKYSETMNDVPRDHPSNNNCCSTIDRIGGRNISSRVGIRLAGIITKVAEQGSIQTGIPAKQMLDSIIADTITASIFEDKPMSQKATKNDATNTKSSGQVHETMNNKMIQKAEAQCMQNSHSPHPIRMMTEVASPASKAPCDMVRKEMNLDLPSSWKQIPLNNTSSGRRLGTGWTEPSRKYCLQTINSAAGYSRGITSR